MESEAMTTVQSGSGATGRLAFEQGSRPFPSTEAVGSSIVGAGKVAAGEMLADLHRSESDLRRFLHGLPGVDQVGAEARAASLATRSIKTSAKLWALEMAVAMVDLTTLEGADTPGKVMSLCAKARRPDPR
jgi:deoxyribose-phosphate aldolase